MAEPILKVTNLETHYGPIMAIRGVSFDVPAGDIVTILGSNGAGKTTVLKTVSGVMDPQKGMVLFEGREIQRLDPDKVMRFGISHRLPLSAWCCCPGPSAAAARLYRSNILSLRIAEIFSPWGSPRSNEFRHARLPSTATRRGGSSCRDVRPVRVDGFPQL
jgi:energy-coupling factor transporter ATP-binding protein EcfA2